MKNIVYTRSNCSYCLKAKAWLNQHSYEYEEINIEQPSVQEKFLAMMAPLGVKTVPQIYMNGDRIGGHDDLMLWARENGIE